jgi:hypothetical protein
MEPHSPHEPSPDDLGAAQGGGRPKHFEGPTVRLNLQLPAETAKRIRHLAVEKGVSPSQIVHEWADLAQRYEILARRMDGLEDDDHQKMPDQNLSWWD